jgi:hypothetical protein
MLSALALGFFFVAAPILIVAKSFSLSRASSARLRIKALKETKRGKISSRHFVGRGRDRQRTFRQRHELGETQSLPFGRERGAAGGESRRLACRPAEPAPANFSRSSQSNDRKGSRLVELRRLSAFRGRAGCGAGFKSRRADGSIPSRSTKQRVHRTLTPSM